MERMTHKRASGIKTGYWSPETKESLVQRLTAYEDTGLEPQEIEALAGTSSRPDEAAAGWISVQDKLPPAYALVIVCRPGRRAAGCRAGEPRCQRLVACVWYPHQADHPLDAPASAAQGGEQP